MRYKFLGKTGVQVSALSFGTMTFGGESDEVTSANLYRTCREAGINHFDCADMYQYGKAEEILGRLVQKERNEIILSTKVYFPFGADVNDRGLSRRHIMQSIDRSLKRLQTDYIDIYFMHRFDSNTPLEESLGAMHDLVASGKVLYLGVSNFAAWQIMKALGISALKGWPSFQVIQPMYNVLKRQAEVEIIPMAISESIAVIPYNPLAGGVLTGKYVSKQNFEGTRFHDRKMYQLRYHNESTTQITNQFVELAKSYGYSPASLAIAWVMNHPGITSPLLGARTVDQLKESLKALEIKMTPELRKEISALSPEPPLATDRSDELVGATHEPPQAVLINKDSLVNSCPSAKG